jgi:hypothetical protein
MGRRRLTGAVVHPDQDNFQVIAVQVGQRLGEHDSSPIGNTTEVYLY